MKRLVAFAIVVLCVGIAYTTPAQIPGEDWTRIAILGINTLAVAPSPNYAVDHTLFAGTAGMGVWYSTDAGGTWAQSASVTGTGSDSLFIARSIVALAVSPAYSSDTTLFALSKVSTTEGSIYKSTNGGQTFALLATIGAAGTSLAISPNYYTDGKVFAGFNGQGLWYSYDHGGTWTKDSASTRMKFLFALAISPTFSSDGYLFTGGYDIEFGPFQRWNGPGSWTSLNQGLATSDIIFSLAARSSTALWAGTGSHGMFYTTTGGSSWTGGCDNVPGATTPAVLSLAVSRYSPITLLEGRIDRLYESTGTPLGGAGTCTASTPIAMIQDVAFERLWNDATHCDIFIATEAGLFKRTCPVPLGFSGPKGMDGQAVALAYRGRGAFLGSAGSGLFKAEARDLGAGSASHTMVQYNNFPNGLTPDIVAICLDPRYDEAATTCGTDASVLFVAANFTNSSADNGVYKSSDWGNTWTKLTGGAWPSTGTVNLNDLAISPHYQEGSVTDTTLFAATDRGLFRWDGGTTYWVDCTNDPTYPVYYKIGLAPTYYRQGGGAYDQTIFAACEDTKNGPGIWYNRYSGDPTNGRWVRMGIYSDNGCPGSPSTVTGFAFPYNFGRSGGTTRVFVSNSRTTCHTVDTSPGYPWSTWYHVDDFPTTPGPTVGANGLATHPSFDENTTQTGLIVATPAGPFSGAFDKSTNRAYWTRSFFPYPSLAITYDAGGGDLAMAGFTAPYPREPSGGALSIASGTEFKYLFTGFNSLPDDVFQTIAHMRTPDILFASSPSMGVFVSENKGLSFRPWNAGNLGSSGCPLKSAYGLAMMTERAGSSWPGWDVLWVGGNNKGIQYRWTTFTASSGIFNLDSWAWTTTNLSAGRFERFTTLGTGTSAPVYAASPSRGSVAGQGIYSTPGTSWGTWSQEPILLPDAPSVKYGYEELKPVAPLTSGIAMNSQSVAYTAWKYYSIVVPSGTGSLSITMTPLANDPDLYVLYGAVPDLDSWDFRPYYGGLSVETVSVAFPTEGIWYIGVRGFSSAGASTYNIVATTSATPPSPGGPAMPALRDGPPKPEVNALESIPGPRAPSAGTVWGTVGASGVTKGSTTGSAPTRAEALIWVMRNGTGSGTLANLNTQTVAQLKDATVVTGCVGSSSNSIFYSPTPDEGRTTWIPSSDSQHLAGACSYDFRDLLEVDRNPSTPSDLRTDCLIAAYGTGVSTSGGVWLSGDKGHNWMKISSGFDPTSQKLNSLVADAGTPTSYYSSTDGTGVYTRTITLQEYPTVTGLCSDSICSASVTGGNVAGGTVIYVRGTGFSTTCPTGFSGDCPDTSPVAIFGVKADGTDNEAATTFLDSTTLSVTVPSHTAGGVQVSVRNPDTRRASTTVSYTYGCTATPPSGLGAITASDADPYAQTGVIVTWPVDPSAWNDGAGMRTYQVLRGLTAGTLSPIAGATIAYGSPATYTDTTGALGTTYYYAVKYTNGCGYSANSTPVTAADLASAPGEAGATPATALKWSSGTKNQLCWGTAAGATGYNIYKGDNALQPVSQLAVPGLTACQAFHGADSGSPPCSTATLNDAPVTPGNFYWYLLDAYNANGEGPLGSGAGGSYKVSSGGACGSP